MLTLSLLSDVLLLAGLIYSLQRCLRQTKLIKQLRSDIAQKEEILQTSQIKAQSLQQEVTQLQAIVQAGNDDTISGVVSYRVFQDRLQQQIKESSRSQMTLAVMVITVRDFDLIRDALGHEVSDLLLTEVAQRIHSCLRQVDSVGRYDRDHFAVMLTQLSKPETAALVVQRMLQTQTRSFKVAQHEINVSICVGIACLPDDGHSAEKLLQCAERALALAESKGDQSYQFYQPDMHKASHRELTLYNALTHENVTQEFNLKYQPILNVQNETMVCMDVVLTWQHPELGLVNMDELFHYAERQQKWNVISEWVIQQAGKQFIQWRSFGVNPGLLGMPLSVKQLESGHFVHRLSQVLKEINFNPKWLMVEVKEASSVVSFDVLEKSFNMLSYLGVNIAIQNVGAGTISLRYLKNLNVHFLKLDASFVSDVVENRQTQALVSSMVAMAKNLSMQVIIQGVDSETQFEVLKSLGCTLMQGLRLGAPLSDRDVVDKMVM